MMGFLIDTNIFNHIVEGKIERNDLPLEFPIFVTPIQFKEIMACPDLNKRTELYSWAKVISDTTFPDIVVDLQGLQTSDNYNFLLGELNRKSPKRVNSNTNDAIIGSVAIENAMVLITNDMNLAEAVKNRGGYVRTIRFNF